MVSLDERRKKTEGMSNLNLARGLDSFADDVQNGRITYTEGPPSIAEVLEVVLTESAIRLRKAEHFSIEAVADMLKDAARMGIEVGKKGTDVDNTTSGIAATVLKDNVMRRISNES